MNKNMNKNINKNINKKTRRRRRLSFKLRGSGTQNNNCPQEIPKHVCKKYKKLGVTPKRLLGSEMRWEIRNVAANFEKKRLPENQRVAAARARFNWKSQNPRQMAIRQGENSNNLRDNSLINVHEATNEDFPPLNVRRKEGYVW